MASMAKKTITTDLMRIFVAKIMHGLQSRCGDRPKVTIRIDAISQIGRGALASEFAVKSNFSVSDLTAFITQPGIYQPRSGFGAYVGSGAAGAGSCFEVVLQAASPSNSTKAKRGLSALFIYRFLFCVN